MSLAGAGGSGPGGRITAADVQQLVASGGGVPAAAGAGAAAVGAAGAVGGYTDLDISNIKRVTAQRLLESKLTIPHYYLTMECQVCLGARVCVHHWLLCAVHGRGGGTRQLGLQACRSSTQLCQAPTCTWRLSDTPPPPPRPPNLTLHSTNRLTA